MANVRNGNTWWVDTSSTNSTASTYIADRNVAIKGILLRCAATTDILTVSDKASGSVAVGSTKLTLRLAAADVSQFFDFSEAPILCPNGLWVTLTGTPTATFILNTSGA